jgi:hypothetical protein
MLTDMSQGDPPIVYDGLILNLDASIDSSYAVGQYGYTYWYDQSGNNNHFRSYANSGFTPFTSTVAQLIGNSISFNGTNQGGILSVTPSSFQLKTHRTFQTLIYLDPNWNSRTYPDGTLICSGIGYDTQFAITIRSDLKIYMSTTNVGVGEYGKISTTALSVGQWYDICIIVDNTTIYLYINGQLDSSYPWIITVPDVISQTDIMSVIDNTYGPHFFMGKVNCIKMYNRSLLAQEVLQNFNATKRMGGL